MQTEFSIQFRRT